MSSTKEKAASFLKRYWLHLILALILILIYRGWLHPGPITDGDWRFYSTKHLADYFSLPFAWDPSIALGRPNLIYLYNFPPYFLAGLMAKLGIPFAWSERLLWLFPFIILAPLCSYYFGKTVFKKREAALACAAVYTLNSAILTRILTFAHVNIAVAFALAPLVLALLLRAKRNHGFRYPVLAGLALTLQCYYDIRIGYLTVLIAAAGWIILCLGSLRRGRAAVLESLRWGCYLAIAVGIFVGANLFWILPSVLGRGFEPGNLNQSWWVGFLSFNKLIHGFTMHDVLWPGRPFEQIGYLARVNPFFVLFPLVGFGAALVALRRLKRDSSRVPIALSGCALTLAGAFLVSGVNVPDKGRVYIWLFNHFPGFSMLRQPFKMYLLVTLGYSLLIALAIDLAGEWLRASTRPYTRFHRISRSVPVAAAMAVLILLLLPALSLSLGGITFPVKVPKSFSEIDRMLDRNKQYFRLFWFPQEQRFAVKDNKHPAIDGASLFYESIPALSSSDNTLSIIKSPLLPGLLDAMAVRMMAAPEDLENWMYPYYADPELAQSKSEFESLVGDMPGNSKPQYLGETAVFYRADGKDHFFIPARTVGVLGNWDSSLMALGVPGLDLNKGVYLLSGQSWEAASSFKSGFPADAFLSCEPTTLDALVPFLKDTNIVPVIEAAKRDDPQTGWVPIGTTEYSSEMAKYFQNVDYYVQRGDLGLGAALVTATHEPLPPDWPERAPVVKIIDMGGHPIPMTTGAAELSLGTDSYSHAPGEKYSIRGSLVPYPPHWWWIRAWSSNVKVLPLHSYGLRFSISARRVGELHTKATFFDKQDRCIGSKIPWTAEKGSFDYNQIKFDVATPANTSYMRFEVWAKGKASVSSSWNLGNVELFDLAGFMGHPSMEVKANVIKRSTYRLLARVYRGPAGGGLSFSVDGGKPVLLDTHDTQGHVSWNEVGRFDLTPGEHPVKITNLLEGTNLVNAVSIVPDEELETSKKTLSNTIASKDIALVLSINTKKVSYSSGSLMSEGSVYCPVSTTLTPTFMGYPDFGKSGVSLRINGTECDLNSLSPTGEPGWVASHPISIPRGEIKVELDYPIPSLVNLPSGRSSAGVADWSTPTGGLTLAPEPSQTKGQLDLEGKLPPGDPNSIQIARSGKFEVKPGTKYSSFVKLEGQNAGKLQAALVMFDENNKELARSALTDETSGTFKTEEESKEVETHYLARYAAVEVLSSPDPKATSSWRLTGLFLNESSALTSPIKKVALIPQSWAQGSAGTIGKEEPPAKVKVLQSSPTGYRVKVIDAKRPFMLVFSEQYAPDWELFIDGKKIKPVPVDTLLNGYPLKKKGTYEVSIRYHPQKWVNIGLIPSILTLIVCFGFLLVDRRRRKSRNKVETKEPTGRDDSQEAWINNSIT